MKKYIPAIGLFIMAIVNFGCAGSTKFESKYAGSNVVIDGDNKDWEGRTTFLKDDNLLFGVQNDNDNLYVLVSTVDRQKKFQILRGGLTIWIDSQGGENRQYGIRYPVEGHNMQFSMNRNQGNEDITSQDITNEMIKNIPPEIELYDPSSKQWSQLGLNETGGINLKMAEHSGRLVYELRIPFKSFDNSFALQQNKDKIGIGIETNQPDRESFRRRNGSEGSEGGRMPGGGGGEGGEGGMRSGGGRRHGGGGGGGAYGQQPGQQRAQAPKAVNEWFVVSLSEK